MTAADLDRAGAHFRYIMRVVSSALRLVALIGIVVSAQISAHPPFATAFVDGHSVPPAWLFPSYCALAGSCLIKATLNMSEGIRAVYGIYASAFIVFTIDIILRYMPDTISRVTIILTITGGAVCFLECLPSRYHLLVEPPHTPRGRELTDRAEGKNCGLAD